MSRPGLSINSVEGYELHEIPTTSVESTPVRQQEVVSGAVPSRPVLRTNVVNSPYSQQVRATNPQNPPHLFYNPQIHQPVQRQSLSGLRTSVGSLVEAQIRCSVCRVALRFTLGVPVVSCPCCRSSTATELMYFLRCFYCGAAYYSQLGAMPFYCRCMHLVQPPNHQIQAPRPPAAPRAHHRSHLSTERQSSLEISRREALTL